MNETSNSMSNSKTFSIVLTIGLSLVANALAVKPSVPAKVSGIGSMQEKPSAINWCKSPSPLARWSSAGSDMQIAYCLADSTDGQGVTVYSRLDVRQENQTSGTVVWKIHDEVKQALSRINLFRPSFAKLDIDGDGEVETFFGYHFVTDGADPIPVKFMSHMGGKKFAIRGEIPMIADDSSSFKMEFDPAFTSAPARLKSVADSLFRKFAIRLCEDPDLGYGIPVPPQLRR
jgi:hypothetical protein